MFNWLKSNQRKILGIDISSSSIKAIEISSDGEQYCLEGFGSIFLPETAMEGAVIKDPDAVADCLRTLMVQERFTTKKTSLAVPDSLTISRMIQVNEGLKEEEIEELVIMEADKYIPYPIDEINLDFNVIGPSTKNSALLDVLIVASRTENVNSRVSAVSRAGLEPIVVEVESYAIERAVRFLTSELPAKGENKIIAIIDIGALFTHFFVMQGRKIIFTREEEFGGKQLIDSLCQRYNMTAQEAEKALNTDNLPEDYESIVLQPFKELILLQVKRGLQFFFSSSHHTYVDHIFLAGGVAKLPELSSLLQEHVNIPTAIANPFKHMDISSKINHDKIYEDAPSFLIACGLAARASTL